VAALGKQEIGGGDGQREAAISMYYRQKDMYINRLVQLYTCGSTYDRPKLCLLPLCLPNPASVEELVIVGNSIGSLCKDERSTRSRCQVLSARKD
jgi:hypothetical protein